MFAISRYCKGCATIVLFTLAQRKKNVMKKEEGKKFNAKRDLRAHHSLYLATVMCWRAKMCLSLALNSITLLALCGILYSTWSSNATLIASSKVRLCGRGDTGLEPQKLDRKKCHKKFVIALAVENGKVSSLSVTLPMYYCGVIECLWCNIRTHTIHR